jgi:hypothetical protein
MPSGLFPARPQRPDTSSAVRHSHLTGHEPACQQAQNPETTKSRPITKIRQDRANFGPAVSRTAQVVRRYALYCG